MENETGVGRDRSRSCRICCRPRCDPRFHWAIECIFSLTILLFGSRNSRFFKIVQHRKCKRHWYWTPLYRALRSHSAGTLSTWPLVDWTILINLLCDFRNKTPGFFYNPTWKMKLVPVGFDPDRIERHCYGADTILLSRWRYCTDYFIMLY